MKKSKLSKRITWRVIGIVTIINVLVIGVIFLFIMAVALFESDMRAQYLMEGIEGRIETMTDAVHQFVGDTEQSDDLTMLAIKFKQHQAI